MTLPPCTNRDPRLFDSTKLRDHLKARAICATCPLVQPCIARAITVAAEHAPGARRGPDGTWGGLLWCSGSIRSLITPECGTPAGYRRHRTNQEPACAACRAAHVQEVA